jgi:hypothetical protein
MVMLPAVHYVSGLAKEKVIVSGDFRQLSPIVPTEQAAIQDVVGPNVFQSARDRAGRRQSKIPKARGDVERAVPDEGRHLPNALHQDVSWRSVHVFETASGAAPTPGAVRR